MRLHSLDTLKFICAVLVVFLHVSTPLRQYYLPITRCAVPCFLIISGYLLWGDEMESRMRKGAVRIFKIIIWSSILYTLQKLIANHFDIHSIIPSGKILFYFLVFNKNPWGFHLWYLGAYLYVLLICILIGKYKLWNFAYIIVPVLLITDILLGKYSLLTLGYEIHYWYLRNWIFVGFPFFLIGTYIKRTRINISKTVVLGGGNIVFYNKYRRKSLISKLWTECHKRSIYKYSLSFRFFILAFSSKETGTIEYDFKDWK